MYDYISLYSDEKYTRWIKTKDFEKYLIDSLKLRKKGNLRFSREINEASIVITGIAADENGNYAFNNLDGVEEINLIEIDVPENLNEKSEEEIIRIAIEIATKFSLCVFDHETSSKIYP